MPTVYKVQHGNSKIEFATEEAAQAYATDNACDTPTSIEKTVPDMSLPNILAAISSKQAQAPKLLADIYAANTLAGITTAQSDEIFDTFSDVILRIKEGAFPTALYRLQAKTPVGFATQGLIDQWSSIITGYL